MVNAIVKSIISSSLLIASLAAQQYPNAMRQTNAQLTVIPLPNPIPIFGGMTGAGTSQVMEPYGSTFIHCTDVNTDPSNTRYRSYEVTDSGGDNVYIWNADQTMLRVVRMGTGSTIVLAVAGTRCVMIPNSVAPSGGQFSLNNPNWDYYQQGVTQVYRRTFNGLNPPTSQLLFDFAKCPLLQGLGTISYTTQINTNDDNVFFMALGVNRQGQDTAQYVVGYRVDNGVCVLYDTLGATVTMAGGIPNVISIGKTSPSFTIHSAYLAPGGQMVIGAGSTCTGCPTNHGPFFWYPGTNRVDSFTILSGGHSTSGNLHYLNITAAPKTAERLFTDLNTPTFVSSNQNVKFPIPQDIHMSWQNVDANDSYPLCMSQMSIKLPLPITITSPLQNEIFCIDFQNTNTWIRLGQTLSSGIPNSVPNFRTQFAIMGNGKKGIIAWSTDLMGNLGRYDGQPGPCVLGNALPDGCRSDVFLLIPPLTGAK